jgi:hypothetical protein
MDMLYTTSKEKHTNTTEKLYIYKISKQNQYLRTSTQSAKTEYSTYSLPVEEATGKIPHHNTNQRRRWKI